MRCSEEELVAIEIGLREHEQKEVFRQARFEDLMAHIVARKADGTVDAWREYLSDELKRLGFSKAEILAGIEVARSQAVEPARKER